MLWVLSNFRVHGNIAFSNFPYPAFAPNSLPAVSRPLISAFGGRFQAHNLMIARSHPEETRSLKNLLTSHNLTLHGLAPAMPAADREAEVNFPPILPKSPVNTAPLWIVPLRSTPPNPEVQRASSKRIRDQTYAPAPKKSKKSKKSRRSAEDTSSKRPARGPSSKKSTGGSSLIVPTPPRSLLDPSERSGYPHLLPSV